MDCKRCRANGRRGPVGGWVGSKGGLLGRRCVKWVPNHIEQAPVRAGAEHHTISLPWLASPCSTAYHSRPGPGPPPPPAATHSRPAHPLCALWSPPAAMAAAVRCDQLDSTTFCSTCRPRSTTANSTMAMGSE